jgi:hypothetical protein
LPFGIYAYPIAYGNWITRSLPAFISNVTMMAPIHRATAILNGLPPVITRVCQESRAIAYESEGWPDSYGEAPLEADWVCSTNGDIRANNFWLDYKRDSVHLNWLPHYGPYYGNGSGSVLMHLAWHAKKLGRRPSIMAECLIDCCVPGNEDEIWEIFELLPSWWAIMRIVVVHTSFREAASSGLFGLLGDACVQIVPVSDQTRINVFYDFADKCERQAPSDQNMQRDTPGFSRRKLKHAMTYGLRSSERANGILSRMHPAIIFRLCISHYNKFNKKGSLARNMH